MRGTFKNAVCVAIVLSCAGCLAPPSGTAQQAAPPGQPSDWLVTSSNRIIRSDGTVWVGRGANLHDTRSCGAGTLVSGAPIDDTREGLDEVRRRIDTLTDEWKADFIRLTLESRRDQDSYVADANYRAIIKNIVDHIGTKPGVYVLLGIWLDPSLDANGWPTDATNRTLAKLATDFYSDSHVLFGVSNEPRGNHDGSLDEQVWLRMNAAVQAIRDTESALGGNRHIVAVQGTRDWGRDLGYYLSHPIAAGGGENVAYETHVYNSPDEFDALFVKPAASLPVLIGEFGPVDNEWNRATVQDMQILMDKAAAAGVPHLAWTFHQYCGPNLIGAQPGMTWDQNSTETDGLGMGLNPTDFGELLRTNLLTPVP